MLNDIHKTVLNPYLSKHFIQFKTAWCHLVMASIISYVPSWLSWASEQLLHMHQLIACKGAVLYELRNRTTVTIWRVVPELEVSSTAILRQEAPSPCVQYVAGNIYTKYTAKRGYYLSTMFITNKTPSTMCT